MTAVEGPKSAGLVARAQNILMRPVAEWDVIDAEPATVGGLYTGYVMILAAIPPIAEVIGALAFGHGMAVPFVVFGAALSYVLALVGVYVVSFIIDALAPSFGGQRNHVQAMKLVAYSNTATWVAGVGGVIPAIGGLISFLGLLYSLYLLYLGLPKLMKSPQDRTVGYFVVSLLVAIGFYFIVAVILGIIAGIAVVGAAATGAAALGGMPH
jgi:hypothetical protein